MAQWIWRWDNGALDNICMLYQRALHFKGADAIVRCLKDIVGTTDKGEITFGIALDNVTRAINRPFERKKVSIITLIAGHQRGGWRIKRQTKLSFVGVFIIWIEQEHAIARKRTAHCSDFE